jgi:hypothetical protein
MIDSRDVQNEKAHNLRDNYRSGSAGNGGKAFTRQRLTSFDTLNDSRQPIGSVLMDRQPGRIAKALADNGSSACS